MSLDQYDLKTEYSHYNLIKDEIVIEDEELEKQNLQVLYALQEQIIKQLHLKDNHQKISFEKNNNLFSSSLLNFLVVATALETFSTSFIFGLSIISLIPAITQPLIFISTIIFAALDTFIACSFQMGYITQCLGIKNNSGLFKYIDNYTVKLELLNDICSKLQHANWSNNDDNYEEYLKIFEAMLKDLKEKSKDIVNYEPSIFYNNMKYFITTFGIASTVASSYFMSTLIIASLAGSLGYSIAPTWATFFITFIILANITAYLLTTHYSLSNLFEPELEKVHYFNEKYNFFKLNYDNLQSTDYVKNLTHDNN